MRCRVSDEHTKTGIEIQEAESPHYAALYCMDCEPPLWLKWLKRGEVRTLDAIMQEPHDTAEEASEDVRGEVCRMDLSVAMTDAIRRTVRDELAKILQAMADAIK